MDPKRRFDIIPDSTCKVATEFWNLLQLVEIKDHHAMQLALVEKHRDKNEHDPECFVNYNVTNKTPE